MESSSPPYENTILRIDPILLRDPNKCCALAIAFWSGTHGLTKDKHRAVALWLHAAYNYRHGKSAHLAGYAYSAGYCNQPEGAVSAEELFQLAVDAGYAPSALMLASLCLRGVGGVAKDPVRVKQHLEKAMQLGDVDAMVLLGKFLCLGGEGVEKDAGRAIQLYESAIELDPPRADALDGLAELFHYGVGNVQKDLPRAKLLYEQAIQAGHAQAKRRLAILLVHGGEGIEKDPVLAKELLESAVDDGDFDAMSYLCFCLWEGDKGIAKDTRRSQKLLDIALDGGGDESLFVLARQLETGGEGVMKNPAGAVMLYEQAIEAGSVIAMTALGKLLYSGAQDIPRDTSRAKKLLERAVAAGCPDAMVNLGLVLLDEDEDAEHGDLPVKELWTTAANEGHIDAKIALGLLLLEGGIGVKKDTKQAINLFEEVASRQDWRGSINIARIYQSGTDDVPRNIASALEQYRKAIEYASFSRETKSWAMTAFAGFLMSEESIASDNNTTQAINLLEEACMTAPSDESLSDLIYVYKHSSKARFRNPQRASELEAVDPVLVSQSLFSADKKAISVALKRNMERQVHKVMQHAVAKPKSCLLLAVGAPCQGKTTTIASLRGLPFMSQYIQTEMMEVSQFVPESSNRGLDDSMLRDLDFREHDFRAVVSRIPTDDLMKFVQPTTDSDREKGTAAEMVAKKAGTATDQSSWENIHKYHGDVLERARYSLTQGVIPSSQGRKFVRCWDLGGQSEYEMSHSLFVTSADILLFVVNLESVGCDATRDGEVAKLCYWMQVAYMLVQCPQDVQTIIVGTHRGEKVKASVALGELRFRLAQQLGDDVYNDWVAEQDDQTPRKLVAIENRLALEDPRGSGLEELEGVLRRCLSDVLKARDPVPVRWLALVDKLRNLQADNRVLWTRKEVEDVSKYFPGFPVDEAQRRQEIHTALAKLSAVSSTVLFQLSKEDWVLSVYPERIVEMFRHLSDPLSWERRLEKKELLRVRKSATLSKDTIFSKIWGAQYQDSEKEKLIQILCECDLLMRLRNPGDGNGRCEEVYGVPSLFRDNSVCENDIEQRRLRPYERKLEVVTQFAVAFPAGLCGGLVSHLGRTIHEGLQRIEMVRKNSTLLDLGDRGRVLVEYQAHAREILWLCMGQDPVQLGQLCVEKLDSFLSHYAHPLRISRTTFVRSDCKENGGCGKSGTVRVGVRNLCDQIGSQNRSAIVCRGCNIQRSVAEVVIDVKVANDLLQFPALISSELFKQINKRCASSIDCFGVDAVSEACKGLSRVLHADRPEDIALFGQQLRDSDSAACEPDFASICIRDEVSPCFAISYVQHKPLEGRFKFSSQQWNNLRLALRRLALCGLKKFRIWLDQCLWIRDASQGCWAHTGILPYVLWPVISLGDKKFESKRTLATYDRVWPFVEELAGLWSQGVITTREQRGRRSEDGCREWLSYNIWERLEPERSMRLLLLNVYHGAADGLRTGWKEDLVELKEMAMWNVESGCDELIIGHEWRIRVSAMRIEKPLSEAIERMGLRKKRQGQLHGEFLEQTKSVAKHGDWHGLLEWLSGNRTTGATQVLQPQDERFQRRLAKLAVVTDKGKFCLLGFERSMRDGTTDEAVHALWLLVALDGHNSIFDRRRVLWTKVVHGKGSCQLSVASPRGVVEMVLSEQLGVPAHDVNVRSVTNLSDMCIDWI